MATKLYYAVVSFGGCVAGAGGVYRSEQEAIEKVIRAERDSNSGGRYSTEAHVLARARVNGYDTRKAAMAANISDSSKQGLRSVKVIYS